jgi:hypothetical protein
MAMGHGWASKQQATSCCCLMPACLVAAGWLQAAQQRRCLRSCLAAVTTMWRGRGPRVLASSFFDPELQEPKSTAQMR